MFVLDFTMSEQFLKFVGLEGKNRLQKENGTCDKGTEFSPSTNRFYTGIVNCIAAIK